jgi:membrane-bound ClpP family serine protease
MVFIGIQTPGLGIEFVGGLFLLLSLMAFQVIGVESTVLLLFAAGFTLILAELQTGIGFLGLAGAICIILGSFVLFPSPHWLLAPEVSRRIRYTLVVTSTALCAFFGFLVYKVAQAKRLRAWTDPGLVEESKGVATTDLTPYGEVRVLSETWRARAEGAPVERGREVQVIRREGLLLLVRPSGEGPSMAEPQLERGGYT